MSPSRFANAPITAVAGCSGPALAYPSLALVSQ